MRFDFYNQINSVQKSLQNRKQEILPILKKKHKLCLDYVNFSRHHLVHQNTMFQIKMKVFSYQCFNIQGNNIRSIY